LKQLKVAVYGEGNVGRHVALEAIAQGAEVTVLSRERPFAAEAIGADFLFLCAGTTGDFRQRVLDTFDAAVTQTIRLLRELQPKRVVAVSSVRIYGFRHTPVAFSEDAPVHTDHVRLDFAYDGAKQALENLMVHGAKEVGAEGVVVRLSNIVGGTIRDERAAMLHHAMRAARSGSKRLETKQHVDSSKDFVHVDDAALGLWLAAIKGQAGATYNIASGVGMSNAELARELGIELLCTDPAAVATHSRIAIQKARLELGYQPVVDSPRALAAAIAA
jgi:UDP-glucose 4-epimerase